MRKQFGPPGKGEIPVLEYQMQVCEAVMSGNQNWAWIGNSQFSLSIEMAQVT